MMNEIITWLTAIGLGIGFSITALFVSYTFFYIIRILLGNVLKDKRAILLIQLLFLILFVFLYTEYRNEQVNSPSYLIK